MEASLVLSTKTELKVALNDDGPASPSSLLSSTSTSPHCEQFPPAIQAAIQQQRFSTHKSTAQVPPVASLEPSNKVMPLPLRSRDDLALTFRPQVMPYVSTRRMKWLKNEKAFLEADKWAIRKQRHHSLSIATARSRTRSSSAEPTSPNSSIEDTTNGRSTKIAPHGQVHLCLESTCRLTIHKDEEFSSLPDYCPPIDSLPDNGNSLDICWSGPSPIDLSHAKFSVLLHPDELQLAGKLRLDCATYLASKRRIFQRRLEFFRANKEFTKTHAQKACKIDVNKASALWTAYEKVGWLDPKWMVDFIIPSKDR